MGSGNLSRTRFSSTQPKTLCQPRAALNPNFLRCRRGVDNPELLTCAQGSEVLACALR